MLRTLARRTYSSEHTTKCSSVRLFRFTCQSSDITTLFFIKKAILFFFKKKRAVIAVAGERLCFEGNTIHPQKRVTL